MSKIFTIVFGLICILFIVMRGIFAIQFSQNCGGYLKQAARSTSIERLEIGVKYIELHNLTSGYTSIFYKTQDEDLGFWYNNLKKSLDELKNTKVSSTLEQSNLLIKFRETIITHTGEGESLICPDGVSVYPRNTFWFMMISFFGLLAGISFLIVIKDY